MSEDGVARELDVGVGTIQTFTRKIVRITNMSEDDIDIVDIAHALSNLCRFTGHCVYFYSVAQHSVLGAMEMFKRTGDYRKSLAFLLHDASEAYICDIPRPLKHLCGFESYLTIELTVQDVICKKFGVDTRSDDIKEMDKAMLATEKRDLMRNSKDRVWSYLPRPLDIDIDRWMPEFAESEFLRKFHMFGG